MSDVIYVAVVIAFFVLCTLVIHVCDRMIGPDDLAEVGRGTDSAPDGEPAALVAASAGADPAVTA
jgi:hypothetical protein